VSLARALEFWKRAEGGYSDHAADPGGATNWGIASAYNPDLGDVRRLTWEDAAEILRVRYWRRHGCDRVAKVAPLAAWALFDFAANAHAGAAKKHFQREVRAKADGVIGPRTLLAARLYVKRYGDRQLATRIVVRRTRRQMNRVQAGSSSIKFAEGWAVRFVELAAAINRTQGRTP
jgi:lysozyme family protein